MGEQTLIRGLKKKKTAALRQLILQYSGYVYTIVQGILGGVMAREDIEEVVSDVFLAVWQSGEQLSEAFATIKPYVAATARNMARNKLRQLRPDGKLEYDVIDLKAQKQLDDTEVRQMLLEALDQMQPVDREIFARHYYLCQTVQEIGAAIDMNPSTVKNHLVAGRRQLETILRERGYTR